MVPEIINSATWFYKTVKKKYMPGFGAKTLIFEPSCIKAAMVIPDGGSSVLGAQRIVL